jgi:DNA-binding MarR family transcriptional regulator
MNAGERDRTGHDELRGRAAGYLVSLIPLYHTALFRYGPTLSGMDVAQFKILHNLSHHGEKPISGIGRRLCISKPHMTALIDAMAEEGLVLRQPDPSDRRVIQVLITKKGRARLAEMVAILRDGIGNRLAALDDQDLALLCRSLEDTRIVLEKVSER